MLPEAGGDGCVLVHQRRHRAARPCPRAQTGAVAVHHQRLHGGRPRDALDRRRARGQGRCATGTVHARVCAELYPTIDDSGGRRGPRARPPAVFGEETKADEQNDPWPLFCTYVYPAPYPEDTRGTRAAREPQDSRCPGVSGRRLPHFVHRAPCILRGAWAHCSTGFRALRLTKPRRVSEA